MIKKLKHFHIRRLLPRRNINSHKGNYGKILLLCGSVGYTGSAVLAAMGAMRCGAGLVYLGVPNSIYQIEATKLTEPIVFPLDDTDGTYAESCIEKISSVIHKMDAVLIGPGIGQSTGTFAVVKYVLEQFKGPVVLDADGINVMQAHKDILRGRTCPTILTPHDGEFVRIGGSLDNNRLASCSRLASELGCIVLLKGHRTVISDGVTHYINTTGNPGMAVGGSGDVLAGMIVSLLGQGMNPLGAAACAAWLHGRAGDICARKLGQYGMLPTDMLNVLPRLMK